MAIHKTALLVGTVLSGFAAFHSDAALAQASASPFTAATRFDAARRVTGTISPDPDRGQGAGGASGPLKFRAMRNSYDPAGRLIKIERGTLETWQPETVAPAGWTGFTVLETVDTLYDAMGRKLRDTLSSGGAAQTVTQYSYDSLGRLRCTAARMNPATFASLPADACVPATAGSFGPDRITRNTYDWTGRLFRVETGVGTSDRRDQALYSYTANGQIASLTDAHGNRAELRYDGHNRQSRWVFPSPTLRGQVNEADYEGYAYDAAGNRTGIRRRDGNLIAFTYDAVNRMTVKDLPGSEPTVTYGYDLLGRMTQAARPSQPTDNLSFSYDALGRLLTQSGWEGTATSHYDSAGRRSRFTYPGAGLYVDHDYLDTGETTAIRENGASSGAGVLARFTYDNLGRRTLLTRGNGTTTSYGYNAAGQLATLVQDLANPGADLTLTFIYNPAAQIVTRSGAHGTYAWQGHAFGSVADTHNGLSQIVTTGATSVGHDANGNISLIGSAGYTYTAENRLRGGPGGAWLTYDVLGRLQFAGIAAPWTYLGHDGDRLIAEYDSWAGVKRRYVHGPDTDEPIAWYEGAGTTDRRWLHADERGSIVAVSNAAGSSIAFNAYDEYGRPSSAAVGRFGYTGQAWIPEIGMSYYRARMYNPQLGRFMQTDPVGYEGGINLYAYVANDPVNRTDPEGLAHCDNPSQNHVCANQYERARREMEAARREGVRAAWAAERRAVEAGGGTRDWTRAERAELLREGKVSGYEGHHRNTVNGNPIEMARNPRNIEFVTRAEHVRIHQASGGFRQPISGMPLVARSVGGLNILTIGTGILSGRIRIDNLDNFFSDMVGMPSREDEARRMRQICGPMYRPGMICA